MRRRTAWWLLLVLLGARPAAAQALSRSRLRGGEHFAKFAVGLSLGFYRPVLRDTPAVQALRDVLSDTRRLIKHPLLYQLQVSFLPLQAGGLLGPYVGIGYSSDTATARICRDAAGLIVRCTQATLPASTPGNDVATLKILPLSLGVAYQLDLLRRAVDWPLVLLVRGGIDYDLWWASVGNERSLVQGNPARPARGGNLGLSGAVALALGLDQYAGRRQPYGRDPSSRDTYLFVEYAAHLGRHLFSNRPWLDLSDVQQLRLGLSMGFR